VTGARAARWPEGRGKIIGLLVLMGGCAILVSTLLIGQYRGAVALQEATDSAFLAYTDNQASHLRNFLDRVEVEMSELAERRVVSAYFHNRALGLTMEYGLRISILDLAAELESRRKNRLPSGEAIYDRLVLIDQDHQVVWDSQQPDLAPGTPWDPHFKRPESDPGNTDFSFAISQENQPTLMHTTACYLNDRKVGQLVAFLPLETIVSLLNGEGNKEGGKSWLLLGDIPLTGQSKSRGSSQQLAALLARGITPGQILRTELEFSPGDSQHIVGTCSSLEGLPLCVIRINEIPGEAAGASPGRILATMALALFGIVAGSVIFARNHVREADLASRLEWEQAQKNEIRAKNKELGAEIRKRKEAQARLLQAKVQAEAASEAKSQFLANMSHEIRTPLNGVLGLTELTLDSELDETQRHYLEIALSSGQSLLHIINDILDFSRIEAGRLNIEKTEFDLHGEIESICAPFRAAIQEKNITFEARISPEVPAWILGDAVRIRQVLVNLVGNAIKFTSEGEVELEISWNQVSGLLTFLVSDTGIGIPAEKLENIFHAFTQADGSTTRNYGGTGLGLTISQQLTVLMGGTLSAESEVGVGSRFRFEIPVTAVQAQAEKPSPSARISPENMKESLKILVAEDNRINQFYIDKLLKNLGHEAHLVGNGVQALEKLISEDFDLALLDVQMPELDGLETARRWRAHETEKDLARLPLIALTAHALPEDRQRCLDAGMDSYLTKPLETDLLLETLEKLDVAKTPVH
jgi:signal transduction histidine kinase/CheY-like chemotaxis protein